MKIKSDRNIIIPVAILLLLIVIISLVVFKIPLSAHIGSDWAKIDFDVKLFRLNTTVMVYKNNVNIGFIKGNIVRFLTDPLTFYDSNGDKLAYADDTYHLIAQDSHAIAVDDIITAEMVGKVKVAGNSYDIYDKDGNKVALSEFDFLKLNGKITDNDGKTIAVYKAHPILKDFTVYISPESQLDETTIIMICASYYSDQYFDSKKNSNNFD